MFVVSLVWLVGGGVWVLGAVVSTPGFASADSSSDWLSSIDSLVGGSALPAPATALDLAISFDGYSLVSDGDATAITTTGEYGLAIAYGDDAYAWANGGTADSAFADGTNAAAGAGGNIGDTGRNYDTAIDVGNNTNDAGLAGNDGAFAGAGGLIGETGDGNNDTAIDVGNNSGEYEGVFAGEGNDNTAIDHASYTTSGLGASASDGNNNYVDVDGPVNSFADAGGDGPSYPGDNDIAYVLDPFGTVGSTAIAGDPGNSDLAAVFGDGLTSSVATSGDYLYDFLSPLGDLPGTAAATSGGFLAELLSLL
jgi:hypothetical protein